MSYDIVIKDYIKFVRLKGHQIIGELRQIILNLKLLMMWLKGHQIIGELRPELVYVKDNKADWKVTRSLVSYDPLPLVM